MKVGPKYKKARKLGAQIFEKTQGQKFALHQQKKQKGNFFRRPRTTYGIQLAEKQKTKLTYAVTEKQFAKYVNKAIAKNTSNTPELLYQQLEKRLDSVILRAGFAETRFKAKQIASHGHMHVNGRKVTIPSYELSEGDVVTIKPSSADKGIFLNLDERLKDADIPSWIKVDAKNRSITITGEPVYNPRESHFDLTAVIQFYKR